MKAFVLRNMIQCLRENIDNWKPSNASGVNGQRTSGKCEWDWTGEINTVFGLTCLGLGMRADECTSTSTVRILGYPLELKSKSSVN
jgi:hypothetical protein